MYLYKYNIDMNYNNNIPTPILILDKNNKVTFANTNFYLNIMYFPQIVELNFIKDIIKDSDKEKINSLIIKARLLNTTESAYCHILILNVENIFPIYKFCSINIKLDNENNMLVVLNLLNTTNTIDTTDTTKDKELINDVMDFIDNAPIALQRLSESGHVLWTNQVTLDLLGYTKEEFIGKHITDFSCDSQEDLNKNFDMILKGGSMHNYSSKWKTKKGEIRHVLIDSNIHRGSDNKVRNTRCFIRDDTIFQIQEARKQIETVNQLNKISAQDNFLRRVLHEIRTPVNIIVQQLDELNEHDIKILTQMKQLMKIIKDVEDADQFEMGKTLVLHPSTFNLINELNKLFDNFIENYASTDSKVKKKFITNKEITPENIFCDKKILLRIISHLLENALKFTDEGYVIFELNIINDNLIFSVTNTGVPLDTDIIHQVCQKYWESKNIDTKFGHGIGLGLNIVFNLLQSLNSTLKISSESGINIFSFCLQLKDISNNTILNENNKDDVVEIVNSIDKTLKLDADQIEPTRRPSWLYPADWIDVEKSEESKKNIITDEEIHISEVKIFKNTCELGKQIPIRPHILIVEDNTVCQKILRNLLNKLNCTSDISSNGKIACDMVLKLKYDLILMDLRMPVMNGLDASKKILNDLGIKVPIIVLSADSTENIQKECYDIGIKHFIQKPASEKHIRNILTTYIYI